MLNVFGFPVGTDIKEHDYAQAIAGANILVSIADELKTIRLVLTTPPDDG